MAKECPFCHQPHFERVNLSSLYEHWQCAGCGFKRKVKLNSTDKSVNNKIKSKNMIPSCEKCGTQMRLREKGTDKFWGCPKWATCGGKTRTYKGEDSQPQPAPQPLQAPLPAKYGGGEVNPQLMQMDLLQAILAVAEQIEINTRKAHQ